MRPESTYKEIAWDTDLLRVRLAQEQPERVVELHRAGAAWCQEHGLVDDAIRHALAAGDPDWAARLLERYLDQTLRRGERVTLRRHLEALPAEVVQCRLGLVLAQAMLEVHRGRLDAAERLLEHADRAVDRQPDPEQPPVPTDGGMVAQVPTAIALVRAELAAARGDPEQTARFARSALAHHPAPAERARLLLAQGQVDQAARWAEAQGLTAEDEPSYLGERDHLVLARVLLARQEPARAVGLLERLDALAESQGRTGDLIEIRALRSLALQAAGDHQGARTLLAETLALARPEGYVRVFVDEGPPMAALLRNLAAAHRRGRVAAGSGAAAEHLRRVIRAFGPARGEPAEEAAPAVSGMVEPLTARELEVLRLLAAGRRNRDIAGELVVTLETVKKHTSHIFDKLDAANRTQAVARARELGLLP